MSPTDREVAEGLRVSPPLWRRLTPFVLGGGLVVYVFSRLDFAEFAVAIRTTNYPAFMAFAVAFLAALLAADTLATRAAYARTVGDVAYGELFVVRAASYLPSILNHHVGQAWLTYFLARAKGAPIMRVAGATLLVYVTTFGGLFVFLILGLPLHAGRFPWLLPTVGVFAALAMLYVLVLARSPKQVMRYPVLAPVVEVGVRGQVILVLYRLPHLAVQFLGAWIPFRFFGVDIPLADAIVLMPVLMFVVALPVSPQGLGTRDALSLALFSGYAEGGPETQASVVAAATLSWLCAITIVQALVSPVFMRRAYQLLGRDGLPASGRRGPPAPGGTALSGGDARRRDR
jgi:hypothetical protein